MDGHTGHGAQYCDALGLDYNLWFSRQYDELLERIKLKNRIEILKNLQRNHKTMEINYYKVRAELKEQYKEFFKNLKGEAKAEYWLFKMKRIKVLARKITQLDEGAFQYLKDIRCTKTPNGFKLEFFFASNPYFKDSVLMKTFHTTRGKQRKVTKTTGMEIEWYPGKSLTETENGDSFFNFFKSPIADHTAEEVQRLMEQDYCIGKIMRYQIIDYKDLGNDSLQDMRFFSPVSYIIYKNRMLRLKYSETREILEAQYLKLCIPLYEKRYKIVNGLTKVEVKDEASMDQGDKATKEKGVPNFWLNAMKNHKLLAPEITERDEEALKYLKDIKWYGTYGGSFSLEFVFQQPNPYFEDDVLIKSYQWPQMERTTGCAIKWHHGKDLRHKLVEGMSKNSKRMMTKICESFFDFFYPRQLCLHDEHTDYPDIYTGYSHEDLAEEVKIKRNYDYYIGKIIRDRIIPHAISWFTREALEEGGEFEDLQDDDSDDEDVEYYGKM